MARQLVEMIAGLALHAVDHLDELAVVGTLLAATERGARTATYRHRLYGCLA